MQKKVLIFTSIVIITVIAGLNVNAVSDENIQDSKTAMLSTSKIITDFYNKQEGNTCRKCFKDNTYPKETITYCITYDSKYPNKLTGETNCDKKGQSCNKKTDIFEFDKKGRLSYYQYWYAEPTEKPIEVTYKYDSKGRIKQEIEKDNNMQKNKYTIVEYKYNGDEQISRFYESSFINFMKQKAENDKVNKCINNDCTYAQSFLPQLTPIEN